MSKGELEKPKRMKLGKELKKAARRYSDGRTLFLLQGKLFLPHEELLVVAEQTTAEVEDLLERAELLGEQIALDSAPEQEIRRLRFVRDGTTYEAYHGTLVNRKTGKRDRVTAGVQTEGLNPASNIVGGSFRTRADVDIVRKKRSTTGYVSSGGSNEGGLNGLFFHSSADAAAGVEVLTRTVFDALLSPLQPALRGGIILKVASVEK